MVKNILVTGGCGFIGSHFVRHLLKAQDSLNVFNFDSLNYAGDIQRLIDVQKEKRYHFIKGDIRNIKDIMKGFLYNIDTIINFAAETHVDNSIKDPFVFEEVNTRGVLNLLNCVREYKIKRFIQISTDEVYGEIKKGKFHEHFSLKPNSPYSASKAAADCFIQAYMRTYKVPAIIIRPCNNYGPWQYPEKFIPVVINKVLQNKKIPIYAKGINKREWLYVSDCVEAIALVLKKGKIGEVYNLGSGVERRNIDVAKHIIKVLGKKENLISFVKDRPGHDCRYSLDFSKLCGLGWKPKINFEKGMNYTINWYKMNTDWVKTKGNNSRIAEKIM